MLIAHVFTRPGVTPQSVADAAGVSLSTAYRWKAGDVEPDSQAVVRLFAAGVLTAKDLVVAGAMPDSAPSDPAPDSPAPAVPPADEGEERAAEVERAS